MRHRLDPLAKLGWLLVGEWLRWREGRDRVAHQNPDAPALRLAQLLAAIDAAAGLLAGYRTWSARLSA